MRPTGWLVLTTLVGGLGTWLAASGMAQRRPSLRTAVRRLHQPTRRSSRSDHPTAAAGPVSALGEAAVRRVRPEWIDRWSRPLRLIDRPVELHVGMLIAIALAGFALPVAVLGLLQATGVVSLQLFVPAGLALLVAVCAPLAAHADAMARAEEVRIDHRHQLSAYLDMVTMLLAGNTAHEGALSRAADAGDGRLFHELRRRMREVSTTGRSLVAALSLVADDLGLDELDQVAATAALSATEGAPVARTLAAKCATLRSTLASEQEAAARIRTDKVTPPLVGMALLFMALIVYPALNLN
jgi:tight adherence protein C